MCNILETKRLILRKLTPADETALRRVLQDKDAIYAYEHAFSDEEVQNWLQNQLRRYREDGFGLWGAALKENGELIGQCGLTYQQFGEKKVVEVGYLFERVHWHRGFATEAAIACKRYAFDVLGLDEVYSIIRENNLPSRRVAERNGMQICGEIVKYYYGMVMPHVVYRAVRGEK